MKIPGLFGMRQKNCCKSLNNIDQRTGMYNDFLNKRSPLLLFRRVAGEGCCKPVGSFGWDYSLSPRFGERVN